MAPVDLIAPEVRGLPTFPEFNVWQYEHQMQWNEYPTDLPPDIKQEILTRLADVPWSRYPEFRPYALVRKVAEIHNVTPESVVVTAGSSDLLKLIFASVLREGDRVVIPSPSFLMYKRLSILQRAEIVPVAMREEEGFALDADQVIDAATKSSAKMLVLCAPNNPTGTIQPVETLRAIARGCTQSLILIDEAYCQFADQDLRPLLDEFENVILARTLSKAFAMAGVRIGYALTSPEIGTELNKPIGAFPLSRFGEVAGMVALEHPEYIAEYTQRIVSERGRLAESLDMIDGLTVYPSGTNFLLVDPGRDARELVDHLKNQHSILISDLSSYPELRGYVRISVGTAAQNDLLVDALRDYLG